MRLARSVCITWRAATPQTMGVASQKCACAAQIGLKGVQTGPRTQGARRASLSAVLALYVSERDGSERFKFTTSPLDQI